MTTGYFKLRLQKVLIQVKPDTKITIIQAIMKPDQENKKQSEFLAGIRFSCYFSIVSLLLYSWFQYCQILADRPLV